MGATESSSRPYFCRKCETPGSVSVEKLIATLLKSLQLPTFFRITKLKALNSNLV
jgi:hypothetical protein